MMRIPEIGFLVADLRMLLDMRQQRSGLVPMTHYYVDRLFRPHAVRLESVGRALMRRL